MTKVRKKKGRQRQSAEKEPRPRQSDRKRQELATEKRGDSDRSRATLKFCGDFNFFLSLSRLFLLLYYVDISTIMFTMFCICHLPQTKRILSFFEKFKVQKLTSAFLIYPIKISRFKGHVIELFPYYNSYKYRWLTKIRLAEIIVHSPILANMLKVYIYYKQVSVLKQNPGKVYTIVFDFCMCNNVFSLVTLTLGELAFLNNILCLYYSISLSCWISFKRKSVVCI